MSKELTTKEWERSTLPKEVKNLLKMFYPWSTLIDYLNTTNAKPEKVLNLVKQSFKPKGQKVVKTDDFNQVRRAWTLWVVLGIYNKFGVPKNKLKTVKITDQILYFVDAQSYKMNYAAFSLKERSWNERSVAQHAKNCRKLWDSAKGKEIRKHLKATKGKLPIFYLRELNKIFDL